MQADFLLLFSRFTWVFFVLGGIFSMLWFVERLSTVFSEEMKEWIKFIAYFGFPVGIVILGVTAINLIAPYLIPPETGVQTGWDVTILGFVLGATVCLRPIKDFKWAALFSLGAGCLSMIFIWLIFAPTSVSPALIGIVLGFMFVTYVSLKFIEDLWVLLGNVLTSPPIAIGLGGLAIVQGILLLFATSLKALFGL